MVTELTSEEKSIGISRACRTLDIIRSSMCYVRIKDDTELHQKLIALAENHPREGFWKYYFRLRNQGKNLNHKRLNRVYKQMDLSLGRKAEKRKIIREKVPLELPRDFTQNWSVDFMSDVLKNGRTIRTFNVMDDYNREILHIEVDYTMKSNRVVWI